MTERRIWIKGASGAGKSTLACRLARELCVPYIELDALHHGPNWAAASAIELKACVVALLDDERGWVVDGNYDDKLGELVFTRADVIVWLDLPLTTKLWRLSQRTTRRWLSRTVLWNGNRETLKGILWGGDALLPWTVKSHFQQRRQWPQYFESKSHVRLRTAKEVELWRSEFVKHAGGSSNKSKDS